MAARRKIIRNFTFVKGKDLRTSDLTPDVNSALDFQNARITKTLSVTNRIGNKICSPNGPYLGLHTHSYPDSVTGATMETVISIDSNLWRRGDQTFTITYTGAATTAVVNFKLNPTTLTYQLTLNDNGVIVLTYDCGTGLEVSPITVTNMRNAINAVANWSAVFTGNASTPAAFLPILLNGDVSSAPKTAIFTYNEWAQIPSTVTNPFSTSFAARGNSNYEPPSFLNLYGNTYIATGYEFLQKYDGNNVYRAGLPAISTPTAALGGAGALNGSYSYLATYKQVDNRGRIYFGNVSIASNVVTPAGANLVNVTLSNLLAGTGFNTDGALFAANVAVGPVSGSVTLAVQNTPHTFHAGDTAYFLNRVTGTYLSLPITAVTATTIVVTYSAGAITTNNNDVASNNLRIQLWRNKNGSTIYYLQGEYPNNSLGATQVIADNTADASLGAAFTYPIKNPDLLQVKPKYVCEHQGVLIVSGDIGNPNTVFFEDVVQREGFPLGSNNYDIPSTFRGGVSGIGSDQEHLIIGFDSSIYYTSGVLNSGTFRTEKVVEGGVGIASHNSIRFITFQEDTGPIGIRQGLIFLSSYGFKMIVNGTQIIDIGAKTNPTFTNPIYNSSQILQLKRATSVNYSKEQLYMCFVPAEAGSGVGKYATDFSTVQVYDYYHNAWGDDTGINMAGGATVYNNNLFWLSKRSDQTLTVTGNLFSSHSSNTENDYADHATGIDFKIGSQWDDGGRGNQEGDPDTDKLFLRMRVYNLLRDLLGASYTVTMQTEKNFIKDVPDTIATMVFGATTTSGWGYFSWGSSSWGTSESLQRTTKLRSGKSRSMRFVFRSSIPQQKIAITGWSYEIANIYRMEMKR